MVAVWSYVLVVVVLAAVLARRLLAARRPPSDLRAFERLARRADLPAVPVSAGGPVPDALVHRVADRLRRRGTASLAGGLVGAGATLLALLLGSDTDRRGAVVDGSTAAFPSFAVEVSLLPAVGVLLVLVGQSAGVLLVAAREAVARPVQGHRRVARVTSPALEDYVPRLETVALCLLAVGPSVAVLLVGAWALVVPAAAPQGYGVLVVVAGLATAVWLVVARLCRRVVAQGQPAAGELELAWDDVLRARALRDLSQLPMMLGVFAAALTAFAAFVGEPGAGVPGAVGLVVAFHVVLGLVLAVLVSLLVRPAERYVLQRLWPGQRAVLSGAGGGR